MNPKITYVFGSGRTIKLESKNQSAKDFFYGYFDFKDEFLDTDYLEFDKDVSNAFFYKLLYFLSKILRKLSNLPFFFESILSKKNKRKFKNSDYIIATTDRIGVSLLPYLIQNKIFSYNKTTTIVMGLLGKNQDKLINKLFQRMFINLFFNCSDNLIFLSKNEYLQSRMSYIKYKDKFHYVPFCTDVNFWNINKKEVSDYVLFIGNDGRRKFDLVLQIAEQLPNLKFKIVSEKIPFDRIKSKNIELVEGQWNKSVLTDHEIKEIYSNAALSIIPIKNSYQPSGQSVALQSMSLKVPVLITDTVGFWDKEKFKDKNNIWFLENNNLQNWCENISYLMDNEQERYKISNKAKKTVNQSFNTQLFYEELKKIIFS